MQYTFNAAGEITSIQQGTSTSASSLTGFVGTQQQTTTTTPWAGRCPPAWSAGATIAALTQYAYDNANNVVCSSVRMNSAVFSSPPPACVQGTPGTAGA